MRRRTAILLGILGLLGMFLFGALTGLKAVFLNDRVYDTLMDRLSVYEDVGISREEQRLINADLADYLSGRIDSLERSVTLRGEKVDCAFNQRELSHMEDVRRLFLIGLKARRLIGLIAFVLLGSAVLTRAERVVGGAVTGAGLTVLLIAGAGVPLLMNADFNTLFLRFHELIFDNELWLLNPATDAMIRMLPEAFFEQIAMMGAAAASIGGITALTLAALTEKGLLRLFKR